MASRSTPVNGVGYDKSLLADAPEVTKADKQEGYNVDLLEQGRPSPRPGTVPPGGTRAPAHGGPNKYAGGGGGGSEESSGLHKGAALPITTKTGGKPPRSKKIVIAIAAVVLLICIAVGVGVGVGVSKSRHNNNNTSNPPADPNATTDTGKPSGSIPVSTETSKPIGGEIVSSTSTSSDENAGGGGVGGIEPSRTLIVPSAINTKAGDVKWVL